MTTREEHLAFCKQRALEYVEVGDLPGAAASMGSDLMSHPETQTFGPEIIFMGAMEAQAGDPEKVRRWIEGFK